MKQIFSSLGLLLLFSLQLTAQDYFADLTSGTTPVLSGDQKALFSATVNVGDNSVKANFFRQYWLNEKDYAAHIKDASQHKDWFGWGTNAKTKTEDGLGSLFGASNFNPGFTGGAYVSFSRMRWDSIANSDTTKIWSFRQRAFILSGTFSTSKFQLYNPASTFDRQLSDTTFKGRSVSLSYMTFHVIGKRARDNMFFGVSVTGSRKSNYSKLDKVDIKNDSVFSNGAGMTRTVETVNDNGNIYALGGYKLYNNLNVRVSFSYIPDALG